LDVYSNHGDSSFGYVPQICAGTMGAVASHELKLLNSLSSVELCAQLLLFMAEQVGMVVTSKDIPSSEHRHA